MQRTRTGRRALPPLLIVTVALAGCATGRGGGGGGAGGLDRDPHYAGLSCAPFARALSGVQLYGEAAAWWDEADGVYARTQTPAVGSVLVLRAGGRLPSGHVSVVSRVLDARTILVIQANWVPGELARDQPVVDVSAANDWSLVRVWYPPIGAIGSHAYPAWGFILPPLRRDHDALAGEAAAAAARAAAGG